MKKKTKPQLRVEIAKDVLKHIGDGRIVAEAGTYFLPKPSRKNAKYKGEQLQKVLPKLKECKVCALGGLFYGFIGKHNNFEVSTSGLDQTMFNNNMMRRMLMDMFEIHQLYLIECAFESCDIAGQCYYNKYYKESTISRAEAYRKKNKLEYAKVGTKEYEKNYDAMNYKADSKALTHIMKNIITNKGTFKP